jgi:hypothetical protein
MKIKKDKKRKNKILALLAACTCALFFAGPFAATTNAAPPPGASTAPYTVSYSGRLTNSTGTPITASQSIRFSLWSDADFDATDLLPTGAINPAAGGFTGWQETHIVTPDSNGLFHVQLGSGVTMPNFTSAAQAFLQVDVKPSASPDTSYEVLDPDGNTANLADRYSLNSAPYAINADTVDNADTGTTAGSIPVLDGAGLLPVIVVPGANNADNYILDFDDTAGPAGKIAVQFGNTLAKFLEYDVAAGWFNFSDNLHVTGNLSVTGSITASGNANFSNTTEFHLRQVGDESTATCTTVDEVVLDTSENRIYVCTAPGSPGTWTPSGTPAQNKSIVYEPVYADAVLDADGTSNNGTVEYFFADTDGAPGNLNYNHYKWRTTKATMQDMDLVLRVTLPKDFASFAATPLQFTYRTDTANAANNRLDLTVEDTNGAVVALAGASALNSTTFATTNVTFGGGPTFTAGNAITVRIKLSATNAGAAYASTLRLNYVSL